MVWKHWLMCQPLWDFLWGKYCWNNYDWWSVVFPAMWTGRWPGGQQGWFSATWPSPDCIKASSSAHTLAHYNNFSQDQHLLDLSRSSLYRINIKCCTMAQQCVLKVAKVAPLWVYGHLCPPILPQWAIWSATLSARFCTILSIAVTFTQWNNTKLAHFIATCPVQCDCAQPVQCAQCADCKLQTADCTRINSVHLSIFMHFSSLPCLQVTVQYLYSVYSVL